MPKFNLGQSVRIIEEARKEGQDLLYVGRVGTVKRMHQVRPGGCVVDVEFDGEERTPSFWEEWLEASN